MVGEGFSGDTDTISGIYFIRVGKARCQEEEADFMFTVRKQRAGVDALLNHASVAKGHEQFVAYFIHLDICNKSKIKQNLYRGINVKIRYFQFFQ